MFGRKVEKARADWPKERLFPKKGFVLVFGSYPPLRYTEILIAAALIPGIVGTIALPPVGGIPLAILGIVLARPIIMRQVKVRVGPQELRVNGRRYARDAVAEFRVQPHPRQYQPAAPGIYKYALEVVMQYGEKPVPVATMREKDREKATALALRLQNWCKSFEEAMALKARGAEASEAVAGGDFGPAPDVR